MGCRKSRTMYSIISTENQEVIRYENTWGLHKISFQELEAVCRRSTTASLPKLVTLINESFGINIPTSIFENSSIGYAEFLTFFIMIGKGSIKDKNSALWYLYDTELEGNLPKDRLKRLLKTIIVASVEVTLKHYLSVNNSTLITAWYQQLIERFESLEIKLAKHFLEENDSISFEVFKAKCESMPLGLISSVSGIRTQIEHTQVIPKRFASPFKTMKVTKLTN